MKQPTDGMYLQQGLKPSSDAHKLATISNTGRMVKDDHWRTKDIKDNEYRVNATPARAEQLVEESHYCFVHQLLKLSN